MEQKKRTNSLDFFIYLESHFTKNCNNNKKIIIPMLRPYTKYTEEQISKIGNTIVYLAKNIENLSKTKLLKLFYILDEISIKKSGIPFLNLKYKVWKLGPVVPELFIEFSTAPDMFSDYFVRAVNGEGHTYIKTQVDFIDDEFTNNDIKLLDLVIEKFGNKKANELIFYTHRERSPWYNVAEENSILEDLNCGKINNTDLDIDLTQLVEHDERKKELYTDYLSCN